MAAIVCATAAASPACASIVNGSFENGTQAGSIPGWVISGDGVERFQPSAAGAGSAADGSWVLDLAFFTSGNGRISQIIPTIPNAYYDIRFALGNTLAFGRDGSGVVDVFIDGTPYVFNTPTATSNDTIWGPETIQHQATGPNINVEFGNSQDPNDHHAFLDDVTVTEVPGPDDGNGGAGGPGGSGGFGDVATALHAPEPASVIAWSTLGLLGAAVGLWRRR